MSVKCEGWVYWPKESIKDDKTRLKNEVHGLKVEVNTFKKKFEEEEKAFNNFATRKREYI